jgi:5-hydroxyisourate hydrolase
VSQISTHVLDIAAGRPAAGMRVRLELLPRDDRQATPAGAEIAAASTDSDGRIASLGPEVIAPGTYRLVFDTGGYLARQRGDKASSTEADADAAVGTDTGSDPFFPEVTATFTVADGEHYHIPLLMSPFGYSIYRGS